jgi:hypothetical protein
MRSTGISHSSFSAPCSNPWGRDPVRAAEDDIRRYLVRHGVLTPPAPVSAPGNGRTLICFLAIYAAIGLAVLFGLFCLSRLECDPLFSDRGLTVACRGRAGNLAKIIGPASDTGFSLSNFSQ